MAFDGDGGRYTGKFLLQIEMHGYVIIVILILFKIIRTILSKCMYVCIKTVTAS